MSKKDTAESEKSDKEEKSDKALFIQRLAAYFIDVLLISFVASLIAMPFIDSESIVKLQDSLTEVSMKAQNLEISMQTFFAESIPLTYQMAKKCGFLTLITLFLQVLYFIVYQFKNDGQTIGKKLMKIKIVSTDDKLTMDQMLFRSLIINEILCNMVIFGLVVLATPNTYYYGTLILGFIQYIVFITSVLMVLLNKKGRGLHDVISHTKVIRENIIKEF